MTGWRIFLCYLALLALTGCARRTQYARDGYDNKLYQHYKNPAEADLFLAHLKEIIQEGESDGAVPHGLYAESTGELKRPCGVRRKVFSFPDT